MNHAIRIDHAALDALLTRWNRDDAPGLVAGVVHPEAGSWKRAHGLASMELPVLNTARTRMRIGSVSKMFTCLAVMLLAEEGKLDPDAPVRGHFPELPEWANAMTFRHWMNHTSGMRCHLDLLLQGGGWSRPSPASALPLLVRQRGVNFAPGALWSYNNSAYQLLSLLVERVSEQSFEAFLERNVLAPIGMTDTLVKRSDLQLLPNSASLHAPRGDGSFERGILGPETVGEGAMVSTLEDMLLWMGQLRAPLVGSAETWRAMVTPGQTAEGRSTGYALGVMVLDYRGVRLWGHSGGVVGGVSMCLTAPDLGLDVVLIANRGDAPVHTLAFDLVDACIERLAQSPEPFRAPPLVGLYHDRTNGVLLRLEDKEGEQALTLAGTGIPVARRSDNRLASTIAALDMSVDLRPDGSITVDARGVAERFEPVEQVPAAPGEAARIVGIYCCDEAECVATIRVDGEQATLRLDGPYGRDNFALEPIRPGLWLSRCISIPGIGLGGTIEFDEAGFTLSTARTRKMPFLRLAEPVPLTLAGRSLPAGTTSPNGGA